MNSRDRVRLHAITNDTFVPGEGGLDPGTRVIEVEVVGTQGGHTPRTLPVRVPDTRSRF
jgi:hypothetical protein